MMKSIVFTIKTVYEKGNTEYQGVEAFIAHMVRDKGPLHNYLSTSALSHNGFCAHQESLQDETQIEVCCFISFIKPVLDKNTVIGKNLTISEYIEASWLAVNHTPIDLTVTRENLNKRKNLFHDNFNILFF